jgi:hypothetical protein
VQIIILFILIKSPWLELFVLIMVEKDADWQ